MNKSKVKLTIYPQDITDDISKVIRRLDSSAIIYPASAILINSKEYFTEKEINYIYKRQEELFSIPLRYPRVVVVRSKVIDQEDIFKILYHIQNKPNYKLYIEKGEDTNEQYK